MIPVASYFKFNPTGAFSVDWYIGKRCNFSCSYCVEYLHDYTSPHAPIENMKKLVDLIHEKEGSNVFWSLTGGEPTIHPKFLELCEYIKAKGSRYTSVTTNGTRNLEYHKKLFNLVDGITQSFHFEFMNHRIDEYIHKFIELEKYRKELNEKLEPHEPKKTLILRFMVETGYIDIIKKMEDAFKAAGITNLEYRYVRPPGKDQGRGMQPLEKFEFRDRRDPNQITDKTKVKKIEEGEASYYQGTEIKEIKKIYQTSTADPEKRKLKFWFYDEGNYIDQDYHYNELNFDKKSNYEGWLCWAGVKHLKISPVGDIYIGNCHVGGKRGNIFNKDSIDLPTEPIRCNKWRCTDNTDLKVPKIKDWDHYHLIKPMIEWKKDNE
jgi:MoaA/NifB/PqqE/SkfB family radical SAM enzyme